MKRMWSAWALVAVLGGGCGKSDEAPAAPVPTAAGDKKPGKVIDLTDNKEVERVALESLQAYRDKNLAQLAELGPANAKDKLIFLEPRNPHYAELLGDDTWRMKSLKAWDGKALTKIARGVDDNALAYYYEDDQFRYAVEVRKDDGRWHFFDLKQQPKVAAKPETKAP